MAALALAALLVAVAAGGWIASDLWHNRGRKRPARIVLTLPLIAKKGVIMPNLEIGINSTEYVPIQTKDAEGDVVPPPAGDTFTVTSSDPSIVASVGTMPSGPLQGAACAVLVAGTTESQNVSVTLTDADGLTAYTQLCDVVGGPPASDFLDVADAINVPNAPPAAKPA